jgi:hypothetical protein
VQELGHLLKFTRGTFYLTEGDRVKFYPDRIEKERYDREWKQLQAHISITWDAYRQYRLAAKKALKV